MKRLTLNDFISQSNQIHKNRYNYSKVVYINNRTKVEIICNLHGSFFQKPNNHLLRLGCRLCGIKKRIIESRMSQKKFIDRCNLAHNNFYDYSKTIYKNQSSKIKILCKKHGEFLQSPHEHLKGQGCPKCTHIISKPESSFLDFVNVPDTKKNRQVRINKFIVDGIINNRIYEFLGDFWHGNPKNKRFSPNSTHPICGIKFKDLYKKEMKKLKKLKSWGYNIKYIWESDWNRYTKKEISYPNIKSV